MNRAAYAFYPALYLLPLRASCFRRSNISYGLLVVSPRYRSERAVLDESLRPRRMLAARCFSTSCPHGYLPMTRLYT